MNFRRHAKPEIFGFQIAPMVDILLVLLVFFIVTWNVSLSERELDVKIPAASHSKESNPMIGEVIVNVRKDGAIFFNRQQIDNDELVAKLQELAKLYPDQAVILRGDERTSYSSIMNVLDICKQANIWNVLFAAAPATN
ncbi:MAG TPA: biopolymer transporter ExbD [Chthoniobacteraceae bacterium]|jgi:biopolymer transport protein ExbD|nr:biopolymer transporter ExbD [Chthoniobacteraceae bacterium]